MYHDFWPLPWFRVTAVNIDVLYAFSVFKRSLLSKFSSTFSFVQSPAAKTLTCSSFSANIPDTDCRYILEETAAYKQAVRETDSDIQPQTYWFANKECFPHLSDIAIRFLSVPTNSVDAERSVSQYTAVSAPQQQSFSDTNLALQVMVAFDARD